MTDHPTREAVERVRRITERDEARRATYATDDIRLLLRALTPPATPEPASDVVEQIGLNVADMVESHMRSSAMIWSLGRDLPDDWMTELRSILVASLETELRTHPHLSDAAKQTDQEFARGDRVRKVEGYPFGDGDAEVLAAYEGRGGWRYVVEHPEGWQHIFSGKQLTGSNMQ